MTKKNLQTHAEYTGELARRRFWRTVRGTLGIAFVIACVAGIVSVISCGGEAPTELLEEPAPIEAEAEPVPLLCDWDFANARSCCLFSDHSYRCEGDGE